VSKPVRPTEAAESEIRYYLQWYEAERSGLAGRLWSEIQDVVHLISDHPAAGSVIPRIRGVKGVRRFPLRRFPFFVIYRELTIMWNWSPLRIIVDAQSTGGRD
jgi:plasmid stabilization system protein ParE